MRILQFAPEQNQVRVRTYSPYTDTWEADADSSSQFTLDVDLSVPQPEPPMAQAGEAPQAVAAALASYPLLGTLTGVPSGSTVSFLWEGLAPLTEYQWYAKVGDGYTPPVTGPTWAFTTASSSTAVGGWVDGGLALAPPAPNPARGALRFSFDLPRAMRVRLEVLDVQGRVVAVLAEGDFGPGRHERTWDTSDDRSRAGAGLYFVRLRTPEGRLVRRVTLLR
jgi:hypothetical protein